MNNSTIDNDKEFLQPKKAKRKYVDFSVNANDESIENLVKLVSIFKFKIICINNPSNTIIRRIDSLEEKYSIKIFPKLFLGLETQNKEKIINSLRIKRKQFPVVSMNCESAELASWAAQDNRIDVISIPYLKLGRLVSISLLNLMNKFHKCFEIPLSELYIRPDRRIQVIRHLTKSIQLMKLKKVPLIFSSGGNNLNELRSPLQLSTVGQLLTKGKVPERDSISSIPLNLINLNLKKISDSYIQPGVWKYEANEFMEEE